MAEAIHGGVWSCAGCVRAPEWTRGKDRYASFPPYASRARRFGTPRSATAPTMTGRRAPALVGGERRLDRPAAMAGDGGHRDRGVVDRLAAAGSADRRFLVLSDQQPALGHLGLACRCLGADHPASVSGGDEHSRREEERRRRGAGRSGGG